MTDMWAIYRAEDADPEKAPAYPWGIGDVVRGVVLAYGRPLPADTPGLREDENGDVSAIVTVVGPIQADWWDTGDGNGIPPGYEGPTDDDWEAAGWFYLAQVRPATPAQAAPILTEERDTALGLLD